MFTDLDGLEMGWRDPVTGQIRPAGPMSISLGSRNASGWVLFAPPTNQNISLPKPPAQSTTFHRGSDYSASVKSKQVQRMATKKATPTTPPPTNTATISPISKMEMEEGAQRYRQYEINKVIARNMQTPEGQAGMALAHTMYAVGSTPVSAYDHASQAIQDTKEGNYWSAAGQAILFGLDASTIINPAGGKVLGLGLEADLTVFKGTGAITWKNAGWQRAGLTRVDWGKALVSEYHFKESFKEAAQNAGSIKFDLSNFKIDYSTPGITNFEFNHIIGNPALLKKTTFIQNGQEVMWNGKELIKK